MPDRHVAAPQPHWHLAWLGVEPGHQGQGIRSILVRQMTTRADGLLAVHLRLAQRADLRASRLPRDARYALALLGSSTLGDGAPATPPALSVSHAVLFGGPQLGDTITSRCAPGLLSSVRHSPSTRRGLFGIAAVRPLREPGCTGRHPARPAGESAWPYPTDCGRAVSIAT
jgi:hypothetical protein